MLYSQEIIANIGLFDIQKQQININNLSFTNNKLNIKKDSTDVFNFIFLLDAIATNNKKDSLNSWQVNCTNFDFNDLDISYSNMVLGNEKQQFVANDIELNISNFQNNTDSTSFLLNKLSLNNGKDFKLENTSAQIEIINNIIRVRKINLKSTYSELKNTDLELKLYNNNSAKDKKFDINLRFGQSRLSLKELGQFIPALKGMKQNVNLSGLIYGNLNDLKGRNITLRTGENTHAIFDFYANDITKPEAMFLFLDLKKSQTSFSDISKVRLPNSSKNKYLEFSKNLYEAGILKFKGNFSGFLSDFVTFGTLESQMGTLTTDVLVQPAKKGEVYYQGNISTSNFQLGKLLKNEELGKITFKGSVDGRYNEITNKISGAFKGNAKQIEFHNYNYKNITFDGNLSEKMFDGLLSINDPNLQFDFLGKLNLNKDSSNFDFKLDLKKAIPANLNLGKDFPNAELAFTMDANFNGNKIDNLDGAIKVKDGYYKNRNGKVNLGGIKLESIQKEGKNQLSLKSDFLDASANGHYNFKSITNDFLKIANHFIPSINLQNNENDKANVFDYQVSVKDINRIAKIFIPEIELETPFILYGAINSPNNELQLSGSIPGVKYKNIWARHIFIGNQNTDKETYSSKFRISELLHRNGMALYNFAIDSKLNNNTLDNTISWSNFAKETYSGVINTQTIFSRPDSAKQLLIKINGLPSQFYLADTLWSIAPYVVTIDSSSLAIDKLKISHKNQKILAQGKITSGKSEFINFNLKDIDLSYFDKYIKTKLELEGTINGTFGISNAFEKPVILSDLNINDLRYRKQPVGNISLLSQWNSDESTIDSELKIIQDKKQSLKAFGYMNPSTQELKYFAEIDSLPLIILETFMGDNFSKFKGYGSGKAEISGTLSELSINGDLLGEKAGLTINATQVAYSFTDTVSFKGNTILFDNITVFDEDKNQANFDGKIVHKNFGNMQFDLHATTEKLRALGTTSRDNDKFYGTAIARGSFDIIGKSEAIRLIGNATSLDGTDIKISMESENTVEQNNFIEFVSTTVEEEDDFFIKKEKKEEGTFNMDFTIEAKPEAKIQLIINSQIGDIIKAQGTGTLLFSMDDDDNMYLSGNYKLTKGDYLFTLENVLNKRFVIAPGGSIVWSGNPYNAIIDLKAIYKLKASLYDLVNSSIIATSQGQTNSEASRRIPVECIIQLKNELTNPAISFDIDFPAISESNKDFLSQFFNTEEEMNKQILSLIVLGKFYTPEYNIRDNYSGQSSSMLGTTASELLSNQLSNWLSQISNNWDVGFNYRPGNAVTNDEIELALSTQLFNNRVTLNGNIGNNANTYSTNNSSQIVGDFEISVKLTPNGKVLLKAYNRSNNNLIYETAPYTQGVGLSFKEEFNTFQELWVRMKSILKKKKE